MQEREIKSLEKSFKAMANVTRLKMLLLLEKSPGLNLKDISKEIRCNIKTSSEHLRRLNNSGAIEKKSNGRNVNHYLTKEGKSILNMISIIRN